MGGHEVGHQVLLLAVLLVQPLVLTLELLIDLDMGLAHIVQYAAHTVLRGHLELAGDMILHQLGKELAALVLEHIVEADAGADEHLLHPGTCRILRRSIK